jgi:predicted permease
MIFQDLRFALRQLRKAPIFTLVAVVTLALGIGANTAIFTLLDQALLRALPVSHPEQLVRLRYTGDAPGHYNSYGGDDNDYFSYPMYRDLRGKSTVFAGLIANDQQNVAVEWNNKPDMANCELVSGNYFSVLGLQSAMGRLLVPSDETPSATPVVVLSFNYWVREFGADPRVLNQTLHINAHPFTIVGVAPPQFHSIVAGSPQDVFVPVTAKNIITPRWQDLDDRNSYWMTVVGRLNPGVSRERAEMSTGLLWHSLREEEFKSFTHQARWRKRFLDDATLQLLDSARGFSPLRDQVGMPLLVLMAMVGLLVVMACVNVSSLLLVRAAGRAREISVRYAMGAGRWRIVRQLLTEGMILGLLGGALGIALAPAVTRTLLRRIVGSTVTDLPFTTRPDLRVLLFAFALAFLVSLAFSLAPALRFLRPDLVNSLKQQSTTGSGGELQFRRLSVGVQIGLSLILLVGAGLFVRTLSNLRSVDIGFTSEHLVGFGINPRLAGYQPDQAFELYKRVEQTLAGLPGTRNVGGTDDPDLVGSSQTGGVTVAGYVYKEDENKQAEEPAVTSGYFSALQVPLLVGRTFTDQDVTGKPNVAVVNATFARRYFGDARNAIGHQISFGGADSKIDIEIVGVVGDTKHTLRDQPLPTVFRPRFQLAEPNYLYFHVRTWQPPQPALANIRTAMQQLDPRLALSNLRTVDDQIADNLSTESLIAVLSASFAVLAVFPAAIGLYGVLAYSTAQRTREIGIRMALGAQRISVMRLVVTDVLWLAGISVAVSLPVSLLLARLLRSQLYGVSPNDPLTLLMGTLLVCAVASLAALIPARRAALVDPMRALRSE